MKLKRTICGLLTVIAFGLQQPVLAGSYGSVSIKSSVKAAYASVSTSFAPVASATDIWDFFGSASKTIKIHKITYLYRSGSSAVAHDAKVIRRSTANSSGTSANCDVVKLDTSSAAASGQPRSYTANPTLGSTVGAVAVFGQPSFGAAGAIGSAGFAAGQPIVIFESSPLRAPITIRGTAEGIGLNVGGVSIGGTVIVAVEWTEE